eukprot:CAMPEP_0198256702 /NCGR_PEP_ID=MMETSP1447-20131203/6543_1 /TAXON_ID=420782 /ORGANISM="Chaetoceros dichaeta, Strain CCMP1751" /LENGTH=159 /DNA_ID=CAMNT_0043943399 /DNA_START=99 /DNA_END=578 /DNA_ORIENTATION=+
MTKPSLQLYGVLLVMAVSIGMIHSFTIPPNCYQTTTTTTGYGSFHTTATTTTATTTSHPVAFPLLAAVDDDESSSSPIVTPGDSVIPDTPVIKCPNCNKCDGSGRILGGIATVIPWFIKAYRPCPNFIANGGNYVRSGQPLDEIAFGVKGGLDVDDYNS